MPSTCFDNTSALQRNRLWLWLTLAIGVVVLPVARGRAAVWVGPTDGNQDWGAFGNWDNNDVPASPGETATINDTLTGNRVISVPAASISTLTWTSDPATFTDTLLLNGDLTLSTAPHFTFSNTGTAAQKVIDLNGFTLSAVGTFGGALTLHSTTPGGVVILRRPPNAAAMQVEAGVIIRTDSGLTQDWSGAAFQDGSVYRANSAYEIDSAPIAGFYDFEVTASGNPRLKNVIVRNDMTIASGGSIEWRGPNRQVRVGGDFTDLQAGNFDYNYFDAGSRSFVFNGGAANQRSVTVLRTGITGTSFHGRPRRGEPRQRQARRRPVHAGELHRPRELPVRRRALHRDRRHGDGRGRGDADLHRGHGHRADRVHRQSVA